MRKFLVVCVACVSAGLCLGEEPPKKTIFDFDDVPEVDAKTLEREREAQRAKKAEPKKIEPAAESLPKKEPAHDSPKAETPRKEPAKTSGSKKVDPAAPRRLRIRNQEPSIVRTGAPGPLEAARELTALRTAEKLENTSDRVATAHKLMSAAPGLEESPKRFAALSFAHEQAIRGGDMALARQVAQELGKYYTVAAPPPRLGAGDYRDPAKEAATRDVLAMADHLELLRPECGEAIEVLASKIKEAAGKLDRPWVGLHTQRLVDAARVKAKEFEKIRPALEKLSANPQDAEARTAVGRYYGLVCGEWERALELLAGGTDAELARLVELEKKGATTLEEQLALGEAWAALCDATLKDKTPLPNARRSLALRAHHWFELAQDGPLNPQRKRADKAVLQYGFIAHDPALPVGPGLVGVIQAHDRLATSVAFSPDGGRLISAGLDGVRVWNVRTLATEREYTKDHAQSAVTSPLTSFALVRGDTTCVWDYRTGRTLAKLHGTAGNIWFLPDGRRIFAGVFIPPTSQNQRVGYTYYIVDAFTGLPQTAYQNVDGGWASNVVFSGDSAQMATLGDAVGRPGVLLWDTSTAKVLSRWVSPQHVVIGRMAYTNTPRRLVALLYPHVHRKLNPGEAEIRDVGNNTFISRLNASIDTFSIKFAFSPDARWLVAPVYDDSTFQVFDVKSGQLMHRFRLPSARRGFPADATDRAAMTKREQESSFPMRGTAWAFSPDMRHVAVSYQDGTVAIWSLTAK